MCYKNNIHKKIEVTDSNNPTEYWRLWKSLKRPNPNSSTLTLNKFDKYFATQVKPNVNYFDRERMGQIESFMNNYDKNKNKYMEYQSDLSNEICNGSITKEEILNHINKLKLKNGIRH